jgi:hypothetical protein
MKRISERLSALEARHSLAEWPPFYPWTIAPGMKTPEPLPGESFFDWVGRVHAENLKHVANASAGAPGESIR